MNIAQVYIDALRCFGYSEREAQFLYMVGTHSGYFTQRQFMTFLGYTSDRATHSFTTKALALRHARQQVFQNNAKVYHLYARNIYRAIGKENIRNRRDHSLEFEKARLAILDFVLAHRDHEFLETEPEKVRLFAEHFNVPVYLMPGRVYRGSNRTPHTKRFFVDKFPMLVERCSSLRPPVMVSFTYVDFGMSSMASFVTHLWAYRPFLRYLPRFRFVYASPRSRQFGQAVRRFSDIIESPIPRGIEHLRRYFKLWAQEDDEGYGALSQEESLFLSRASHEYFGQGFRSLYQAWREGKVSDEQLEPSLSKYIRKPEVTFHTFVLPKDYSAFGQNAWFSRKAAGEPQRVGLSPQFSREFDQKE